MVPERNQHRLKLLFFSFAAGKVQAKKEQRQLVEQFQLQPGKHVSNMSIEEPPSTKGEAQATVAWALEELKDLTHEEYTEFVGNARITSVKARSTLEKDFVRWAGGSAHQGAAQHVREDA